MDARQMKIAARASKPRRRFPQQSELLGDDGDRNLRDDFGMQPERDGVGPDGVDRMIEVDLPLVQLIEAGLGGGVMADALAVPVPRRGVRVEADRQYDLAAHGEVVVRLLELGVEPGGAAQADDGREAADCGVRLRREGERDRVV